MDFQRISGSIDVETLSQKKITILGTGGAVGLVTDLTRSGVQDWLLNDFDRIGSENVARQGHDPAQVGRYKVDAVKDRIQEINPDAVVETLVDDLTTMTEEQALAHVFGTDLFIATTDSFAAQALVNRLSLMLNVPAIFVGIYDQGLGAEVIWTDPARVEPCFRCLVASRYKIREQPPEPNMEALDPTSQDVDIFSVRFPDAIAGQLTIGLLTQGADNRYGRLIKQLGDRQFIQIGMSPEFEINGRDLIREKLGVPAEQSSYFTWNSIALTDPDRGQLLCVDCEELRGRQFVQNENGWERVISGSESLDSVSL